MSRGVFYRANVLTPSPEDLAIVESLGLTAVYDVRSETEANETPDIVPAPAIVRPHSHPVRQHPRRGNGSPNS